MIERDGLPKKVFFSCTPDEFVVVDVAAFGQSLKGDEIEPWMTFEKGPGNVIDSAPKKVASQQGDHVDVECEDGVVYIDFYEGTVRKETGGRAFIYKGTIDQRNGGLGYMPVS